MMGYSLNAQAQGIRFWKRGGFHLNVSYTYILRISRYKKHSGYGPIIKSNGGPPIQSIEWPSTRCESVLIFLLLLGHVHYWLTVASNLAQSGFNLR